MSGVYKQRGEDGGSRWVGGYIMGCMDRQKKLGRGKGEERVIVSVRYLVSEIHSRVYIFLFLIIT